MANDNKGKVVGKIEMELALQFVHLMGMQTKSDVYVVKSRLDALVQLLVDNDLVDGTELAQLETQRREAESHRMKDHALVQIADSTDKYQVPSAEDLDCAERLHLCHARCCSYDVKLSPQDLDEGHLRWDYARPYTLPHKDGYCVYSCRGEGGGCAEYAHRPAACRTYDCRKDERIWVDFEGRIATPMDKAD